VSNTLVNLALLTVGLYLLTATLRTMLEFPLLLSRIHGQWRLDRVRQIVERELEQTLAMPQAVPVARPAPEVNGKV